MCFGGISVTKNGERLRKTGGLSYSRLRELLLSKISQLGYDPKPFGLHSLRAGGATAAANADVPDRLFKRHGHWKSESAKDGYIKDSLGKRLKVSAACTMDLNQIGGWQGGGDVTCGSGMGREIHVSVG